MSERDLLLEIGTEEIPSRFMTPAQEDLVAIAKEEFANARIAFRDMQTGGTPRRLALFIRSVEERQSDAAQEFRGPAWAQAFDDNGNPTNAARGFAKGRGVDVEALEMREVDGVKYTFAVTRTVGQPTVGLLPGLLEKIVRRLSFPKSMFWADPSVRFARPVRWILALWGSDVVPFTFCGCAAGRTTSGHRFLGKRRFDVPGVKEYMDLLYDNYVIVDPDKRREKLLSGVAEIEKEIGGRADLSPALVEENLYLVEYPVPFYGAFDDAFLDMPAEVLTTTMAVHQRYFPVRDESGRLMARFVGVSNNRATNMAVVREGNERVLRARLSDAAFFWREDQKKPLANRVEELKSIVYQEQLGTMYDKTVRARAIAGRLCVELGLSADVVKLVDRAAFLAKSDVVTHMVYEFAELRGVMGREYARRNGEPDRVSLALYEQYLPVAAGGEIPTDVVGAVIGLADRMDTIVACIKVGLEPTGSQDPYGLRRAARCINEILWGMKLDVNLNDLLADAAKTVEAGDEVVEKVRAFLKQRLQVQLRERGFPHGTVSLAMQVAWERPLRLLSLIEALSAVEGETWFQALATAHARVRNILAKAVDVPSGWRDDLLQESAERNLAAAVLSVAPEVRDAVGKGEWKVLTAALAKLEPAVTAFFDAVLVMAEDPDVRMNRLGLLAGCNELFLNVGDLGQMKK